MILAITLLLIPWLINDGRFSYLFLVFMTLILISMFNDDTFSSFTGASFFFIFNTLLIVTSQPVRSIFIIAGCGEEC